LPVEFGHWDTPLVRLVIDRVSLGPEPLHWFFRLSVSFSLIKLIRILLRWWRRCSILCLNLARNWLEILFTDNLLPRFVHKLRLIDWLLITWLNVIFLHYVQNTVSMFSDSYSWRFKRLTLFDFDLLKLFLFEGNFLILAYHLYFEFNILTI
jgi:hypothetical protein